MSEGVWPRTVLALAQRLVRREDSPDIVQQNAPLGAQSVLSLRLRLSETGVVEPLEPSTDLRLRGELARLERSDD